MRSTRRDSRLIRLLRLRLLIPLQRNAHLPEQTARGVMIGLGIALTPTDGIQIPLVVLAWLMARRLFGWHFSAVVATVWTCVSNPVTTPPCYYLFYLTGRLMLGRWEGLSGYAEVTALWHGAIALEGISLSALAAGLPRFLGEWGLPLFLGSLPYAALGAWLGYRWGLRFILRCRALRLQRIEHSRRARAAA